MAAGFAVHIKADAVQPRPAVRAAPGDAGAPKTVGLDGDGAPAAKRAPELRPHIPRPGPLPNIRESEELNDEEAAVMMTPDMAQGSPDTASPGRWTRSKDERRQRRRRKRSGASRGRQARRISPWVYASACGASIAVGAVFFILMYAFRDHLGKWWKAL